VHYSDLEFTNQTWAIEDAASLDEDPHSLAVWMVEEGWLMPLLR
jgi:hypothetical protein